MFQSLDRTIRSLQQLKAKVEMMAPGGDLESLIEEGLAQVNRECYEMCLDARRQSVSNAPAPEDFPPSGVSGVRGATAPRGAAPAPGSDASGRGEL